MDRVELKKKMKGMPCCYAICIIVITALVILCETRQKKGGIPKERLTIKNVEVLIDNIKQRNPYWDGQHAIIYDSNEPIGIDFSHIEHDLINSGKKILSETKIDDLMPLSGINIRILRIPYSRIKNINFLRGTDIEELDISHSAVKTISSLQVDKLRKINLAYTQVTDISILAQGPLEELNLTGNLEIRDISPVRSIKSLKSLKMQGVHPKNIAPLHKLTLETLHISPLQARELKGLFPNNLRELTIREVDSDIEFRGEKGISHTFSLKFDHDLIYLERLDVGWEVDSLKHIIASPMLVKVILRGSRFPSNDCNFVSKKIKYLNLAWTGIESIDGIETSHIEYLDLSNTQISVLPQLNNVKQVFISDTLVDSLEIINPFCEVLDISNTKVAFIPQKLMNNLKFLKMRYIDLKNIDDLRNAKQLTVLDISGYKGKLNLVAIMPFSVKKLMINDCPLPSITLVIPEKIILEYLSVAGITSLRSLKMDVSALSVLNIGRTNISDLSFLPSSGIKVLLAYNTPISSLCGIVGEKTEKLNLSHCNIDSFLPLHNTSIKELDVSFSNFNSHDIRFLPLNSIRILNLAGTGITRVESKIEKKLDYVMLDE